MKGRNLVLHPSERCLYLSTRKATRDDDRFECFQLNIEKNVLRTESLDFLWDTVNENRGSDVRGSFQKERVQSLHKRFKFGSWK